MFVGIGVGVGRQRFAGGFADSYSERVLADGGTIEALSCVAGVSTLLQQASLLIVPSGYKAGVAYSALPNNGNGDLTWSRNSTAYRTQSDGNIGSVAANVPRLSYMYGSCPAALLEPQRTNSIRNSTMVGAVSGKPGTLPNNWTNAGAGLSREIVGTGTESGLNYIDIRIFGTATNVFHDIFAETQSGISASVGQTWTSSTYLKYIATPQPPNNAILAMREFSSGVGFLGIYQSSVLGINTTLNRFAFSRALVNATVAFVQQSIFFNLTNGNSYDFTIRIAQPQMELGAYATTPIFTSGATATRLADTFTRNNIYTNGLISASGGTWYVEFKNNVAYARDNSNVSINLDDSVGFNNGFLLRNSAVTGRLSIQKTISGSATTLYTTTTDTTKIAIKWNGSTADVFVNGTKVVSATAFTTTQLQNFITSMQVPVFIQQMAISIT